VRVVGEGTFIIAKRRERRDARSGGLNRKRERTGNDFTYKNGWVEYKLALPRLNSDLAASHSSLSLSPSISLPSCVTSASSCYVISPRSHQFFKDSDASMDSSLRRFLSGVINFFILLNTRSYSADIAGIADMSKA
jgi:hypothetical protein